MSKNNSPSTPHRFVCVTNIPSSYRLYEFEIINQILQKRGIEFEVIFMATTEPGRHWQFNPQDWNFQSRVAWGVHPTWRELAFHFNPGILWELIKRPPTWLLLGGGWQVPTDFYLSTAAKVLLKNTLIFFWVEATVQYTHFSRSGLLRSMRKTALSMHDGFVVPGQCSIDYINEILDNPAIPFIHLANFVDERDYYEKVQHLMSDRETLRNKWKLGHNIAFLWPARLIEEKGILQFLDAIKNIPGEGFQILLAGDGPLYEEIFAFIDLHEMRHVRLIGHQALPQLLELYCASDILLFPSPREPYGFVAVEALWAGLPLLLSRTIGALPEVLEVGNNGWDFDPFDPQQIQQIFRKVLSTDQSNLKAMGKQSLSIAQKKFNGIKATEDFINQLMDKMPARKK